MTRYILEGIRGIVDRRNSREGEIEGYGEDSTCKYGEYQARKYGYAGDLGYRRSEANGAGNSRGGILIDSLDNVGDTELKFKKTGEDR